MNIHSNNKLHHLQQISSTMNSQIDINLMQTNLLKFQFLIQQNKERIQTKQNFYQMIQLKNQFKDLKIKSLILCRQVLALLIQLLNEPKSGKNKNKRNNNFCKDKKN